MFRGRYWSPALPLPSSSSASLSLFKLQAGLRTLSSSLFPLRALTCMTGTRERRDCRQEEEWRNGGEGYRWRTPADGWRQRQQEEKVIAGELPVSDLGSLLGTRFEITERSHTKMLLYYDASIKFESLLINLKACASPPAVTASIFPAGYMITEQFLTPCPTFQSQEQLLSSWLCPLFNQHPSTHIWIQFFETACILECRCYFTCEEVNATNLQHLQN